MASKGEMKAPASGKAKGSSSMKATLQMVFLFVGETKQRTAYL